MKRLLLALFLLLVFTATSMAQGSAGPSSAGSINFNSPKPQFLSFNLGVPFGYDFKSEKMAAGYNFGMSLVIADDFHVGYDFMNLENNDEKNKRPTEDSRRVFNSLRMAYYLTPVVGAAFGVGALENMVKSTTGVSMGVFADLAQQRSALGVAYGLRLRMDYIAATNKLGKGALMFTIGTNFGL